MTRAEKLAAALTVIIWVAALWWMLEDASATELDPRAVATGEAYWAPANNGAPVCEGMTLLMEPAGSGPAMGWTFLGKGCNAIHFDERKGDESVVLQCAGVAHEIGHAVFALEHNDDPASIMNGTVLKVPEACAALDPTARYEATAGPPPAVTMPAAPAPPPALHPAAVRAATHQPHRRSWLRAHWRLRHTTPKEAA